MQRFNIKTAVYGIIKKDGKVLFLKRQNTGWMDGMYTLPSGHIEEHELPSDTMIRELKEEASVIAQTKDLKLGHVMYEKDAYIDFYFDIMAYDGDITIGEPDKCSEILWEVDISSNEKIVPKVKKALLSYMRGEMFSEITKTEEN